MSENVSKDRSGAFDVAGADDLNFDIQATHDEKTSSTPAVLLSKALELVFRQMRISGRRDRTIESYDFAMNNLISLSGVKYVHEIDSDCLYDYLDKLDVAMSTKLIRLKSIKAVLSRFFDNGWYTHKFWTNINLRIDREVKQGAEQRDISLLLEVLDKTSFTGLRDAVAVLLMYRTGIRITTLGLLREKHIDFSRLELNLDASIMKGRSFLRLPIDEQLAANLQRLIFENNKVREFKKISNDFVFITVHGTSVSGSRSNTNVISRQLSKHAKRFGLKNINSQAIRRAYAKNLLERGAKLPLISKALGHKDLATTTQYLHIGVSEASKDLREFL